jgi:hypothetical protein
VLPSSRHFQHVVARMGATLVRPDRKDEPPRHGGLAGMRQWIESIIDSLKGQLGLEHHSGRTLDGVVTRVTQRLLVNRPGILGGSDP